MNVISMPHFLKNNVQTKVTSGKIAKVKRGENGHKMTWHFRFRPCTYYVPREEGEENWGRRRILVGAIFSPPPPYIQC